jgi:DNA excision repair protein ERCC-8
MANHHLLPKSLPLLLQHRREGRFHFTHYYNGAFATGLARHYDKKSLLPQPQIETPVQPTTSTRGTTARGSSSEITSLHVDRVENRFVLAGSDDATISIYDLSQWGCEYYFLKDHHHPYGSFNNNKTMSCSAEAARYRHKPIARSVREVPRAFAAASTGTNNFLLHVPSGHASPISHVQWYPVDSGAFLSSSKDGSLLVWDTETMSPVSHCTPFSTKDICTFHLSSRNMAGNVVVVASFHDPSIKLVDIRSGASSHTLLGHSSQGLSSVQWAPHNDVILASGGMDGTVRLWDIRKGGSRSCISILNQDGTTTVTTGASTSNKPYSPYYTHLPRPSFSLHNNDKNDTHQSSGGRTLTISTKNAAPNNYRATESSTFVSHAGPVSALAFAGWDGHFLVSAGQDGALKVWDLRSSSGVNWIPLRFLAPDHPQPAISRNRKQVPILLTPHEGIGTTCCWVGNGSKLLGYGLDRGGTPQQVLEGHLHTITAIDAIEGERKLLTAGKDGLILAWGRSQQQTQLLRKRKHQLDQDSW